MDLICITSYDLVSNFQNMSLDTIEFDNYNQVNRPQQVIIVDENGFVEQSMIRYLVELGCSIYYVCDEVNQELINYLINNNQFNIYTEVDVHSLSASRILEITKTSKTKEDVSVEVNTTSKVFSLSTGIDALVEFIDAIDCKDVDRITNVFNQHFDDFKSVKSLIESNILEVDSSKNQIKTLTTELEAKVKEFEELDERFGNLVECGKQCEDANQELTEQLVSCKNKLAEVESRLEKADTRIDEMLINVQNKDSELRDMSDLVDSLKLNLNNMQVRNKQLIKDNDLLKESLNSIKSIPEDPEVNITDLGSVNKIMYVKMIDPMPYWISAFKYYQKYNGGANKNSTGLVLITQKDSVLNSSYIEANQSNLVNSNTQYVDCDKKLYVMEGYKSDIKKYIQECKCTSVVILDYTYSDTVFTKCINQIELFGINNKKSYMDLGIAPKVCISQARVEGVPCRLPFVENYDSLNPVDKINIYKDSVFTYLDKCWW